MYELGIMGFFLMANIIILVLCVFYLKKFVKLDKTVVNKISQLKSGQNGTQGIRGNPGPKGDKGNDGGSFLKNGPLRNINATMNNNNNKFVTRMYGNLPSSIAYLGNNMFYPENEWTLSSNGELINGYDKSCLTVNKLTNDIHMGPCINSSNQKWNYDTMGRIRYKSNKNLCIGLNQNNDIKSASIIKKSKSNTQNLNGQTLNELNLQKCFDNNNINYQQQWQFY